MVLAALGVLVWLALSPGLAAAETARSANSFVDSIGVNTHLGYEDTPYYTEFGTVEQRLSELGVHHIREYLTPESPDQYAHLNALAARGIGADLVLGSPSGSRTGLEDLVGVVRDQVRGATESVEGPNEYDTQGDPGWSSHLADYQQQLFSSVKSDPSLAALPVIGPSVVQRPNEESLGDISGVLDYGNVHPYPNGQTPEGNVDSYLARAALNAESKPVVATESGYDTALHSSGELLPVSEDAMATYMPRLFLEYFSRGIVRTYAYELLDEWSNPGQDDPQAHFGLLRNDLSPKPAFDALRNTISIFNDSGPEFIPEAAEYAVEGNQRNLHRVLLQKSDGSYYLALWRADSVWDPVGRVSVQAPAEPLTVSFERPVENAQRYMPNVSSAPLGTVADRGNRLTVSVGAQVVILQVKLGDSAGGHRIRFWVSRHSVPAGGHVAVGGRLPQQASGGRQDVAIQRWQIGQGRWQTVGHGRTSSRGKFRKALRLSPRRFGRAPRLRLIARQTRPSRPQRIRIRGRAGGVRLAVDAATVVAPGSGATE